MRITLRNKLLIIRISWIILAVLVVSGGIFMLLKLKNDQRQTDARLGNETTAEEETPELEPTFHGNSPNCPEKYCISTMITGDLLFHERMWQYFATDDGFDFSSLLAPEEKYIAKSDVAICNFETPIAELGGPYTDYPIFNIPPQIADTVAKVGYKACTTDTNHSVDKGTAGVNRLIDKLDSLGTKHTGTYKTEAESNEPLIIEAETGKVALIGGTVSLNGNVAEYAWQVDRMNSQNDIDKAIAKAKKAREMGADIVLLQLHSVTEYIDYADAWQTSVAHQMAETGLFDLIYFHGSHTVQPVEKYADTYILYGLGNSVTVTAEFVTNLQDQGLTFRAQFASADGFEWTLSRLSYLPTYNKTGSEYAWCPLANGSTNGFCVSETTDAEMYNRIKNVIYSGNIGEDNPILKPWVIAEE